MSVPDHCLSFYFISVCVSGVGGGVYNLRTGKIHAEG